MIGKKRLVCSGPGQDNAVDKICITLRAKLRRIERQIPAAACGQLGQHGPRRIAGDAVGSQIAPGNHRQITGIKDDACFAAGVITRDKHHIPAPSCLPLRVIKPRFPGGRADAAKADMQRTVGPADNSRIHADALRIDSDRLRQPLTAGKSRQFGHCVSRIVVRDNGVALRI